MIRRLTCQRQDNVRKLQFSIVSARALLLIPAPNDLTAGLGGYRLSSRQRSLQFRYPRTPTARPRPSRKGREASAGGERSGYPPREPSFEETIRVPRATILIAKSVPKRNARHKALVCMD